MTHTDSTMPTEQNAATSAAAPCSAIDTDCDAWHVFCGHWFAMVGTNPHPRDSRVLMCWAWFRAGDSWGERKPREPETQKEWQPMLRTGDLKMSLYAGDTLEIRDGQTIYVHLTPPETADFLRWIDARDKSPNNELSGRRPLSKEQPESGTPSAEVNG